MPRYVASVTLEIDADVIIDAPSFNAAKQAAQRWVANAYPSDRVFGDYDEPGCVELNRVVESDEFPVGEYSADVTVEASKCATNS